MSTNGAPGENPPSLNILAQYVKDLSFENPHAPRSLIQQPDQQGPNIEIQVNVNAQQISDTDVEVELKVDGSANRSDGVLFAFELAYAGVFRIMNISDEDRGPVVLIECPRLLFPFARQIVADAVRNGGFPPLMIDPIDFAALYRQRMSELAQEQAGQIRPS
jgi:preprotein translocase subunit SecB